MFPYYLQVVSGGLITHEVEQPTELVAMEVARQVVDDSSFIGDYIRVLDYFGEIVLQQAPKARKEKEAA